MNPWTLPAAVVALMATAWPAHAQDPLLARSLAATCANCHGTDGRAIGEMKSLAGTPAARTVAMFADYRSGKLPATVMHQIAKGYTDEQVRLIADYFAAQPASR